MTYSARGTTKKLAILIASLFALFGPHFAFADYTAFQNKAPTNEALVAPYVMYGFSAGTAGFRYDATTTVTQFDRIDIPFCRSGGAEGGSVYLEVRTTATTGPIIASSTLAVNAGNVASTGCLGLVNATSSTFVLNQNVQWVNGVQIFFVFRLVGTTGTFYFSQIMNGGTDTGPYTWYQNGTPLYTGSDYINTYVIGRGLGTAPANQGQGVIYNASGTPVVCTTLDVGCYISTSLSFLFVPSIPLSTQLGVLASTTSGVVPFGYVSDLYGKFETYANTATTTLTISVELSPLLNWLGASFPTTTVTVLSGAGLRTTMGPSMWAFTQTLLAGLLWVGFAFYVYRRSIHLL